MQERELGLPLALEMKSYIANQNSAIMRPEDPWNMNKNSKNVSPRRRGTYFVPRTASATPPAICPTTGPATAVIAALPISITTLRYCVWAGDQVLTYDRREHGLSYSTNYAS